MYVPVAIVVSKFKALEMRWLRKEGRGGSKIISNLKRPLFEINRLNNNRHRSLTRNLQIICRFRRRIDATRTLYGGLSKLPTLLNTRELLLMEWSKF